MGGKSKGGNFERVICKQLSMWWTEGERNDVFWRTSNSGGRATVRRRGGKSTFGQYGDIQATDPIGQPLIDACSLELKVGYGNYSFLDMLDRSSESNERQYEKFLKQSVEDAKKGGAKWPVIISKRDRKVPIITIPKNMCQFIVKRYGRIEDYEDIHCGVSFYIDTFEKGWYCFRLEDFLFWVPPKFFIKQLWNKKIRRRNKDA